MMSGRRRSDRTCDRAEELLPLNALDFTVLLVLTDGDSHGYAIANAIRERSGGRINILPGNFYTVIDRLQRDGLIAPSDATPEGKAPGRPRRLFRITRLGVAAAKAEAIRLAELTEDDGVQRLLQEDV